MKTKLIALAMIGLMHYGANAQAGHNKNDINYKVCRTESGYYKVCSGPYNGIKETRADELQTPAGNGEANNVIPLSKGTSKYDINYKVCLVNDKYKVCNPDEPLIQPAPKAHVVDAPAIASLSMMETNAHAGYTSKNDNDQDK